MRPGGFENAAPSGMQEEDDRRSQAFYDQPRWHAFKHTGPFGSLELRT